MPITQNEKIIFLKKGKEIEDNFTKVFNNAISASKDDDINKHVDVIVNVGIDVKGLKKINRKDQETNEHIHWVELKNVNGKPGWLYGEADFFAFEIKDYWIIVGRQELQRFIAEKCRDKIRAVTPEPYKLYQRKERKDIITLVSSYDLCYICTKIIRKKNEK
jgi:hypothetical protein